MFIYIIQQPYKYLIVTRLSDHGFLEQSLSYLEQFSHLVMQNPTMVDPSLMEKMCQLADRLKYNDLMGDADDTTSVDDNLNMSRPDNTWLRDLKIFQQNMCVSKLCCDFKFRRLAVVNSVFLNFNNNETT